MAYVPLPPPPIVELPLHPLHGPTPLPPQPSVIIGSSSGDNDSSAAILYTRWRWPNVPILLWHALLDAMDWEQITVAAIAKGTGLIQHELTTFDEPAGNRHGGRR